DRVELDSAGRVTRRSRGNIFHRRGQPRLGGDGTADGLRRGGHALATTTGDVDLQLTGRGDDVAGVGLTLVDLLARGGRVTNFVDGQRVLAADAVDELLRARHG